VHPKGVTRSEVGNVIAEVLVIDEIGGLHGSSSGGRVRSVGFGRSS